MSEDLECKQMLKECQTKNYSYCQQTENSGFKQESLLSAYKKSQPCTKDN